MLTQINDPKSTIVSQKQYTVLDPPSIQLRRGSVAFCRTTHRTVSLRDVARLLSQLIFINEAAFLLTGFFRVGPWLLLTRCKDPIKHHTSVMHQGGDEEDILPLFTGLRTETEMESVSRHHPHEDKLTLFFVIAPTISGQTMPDKVPTPLEIPMRMLAYRGAMSRWFTLKPATKQGTHKPTRRRGALSFQLAFCTHVT